MKIERERALEHLITERSSNTVNERVRKASKCSHVYFFP